MQTRSFIEAMKSSSNMICLDRNRTHSLLEAMISVINTILSDRNRKNETVIH
jgi:hypothetical protein